MTAGIARFSCAPATSERGLHVRPTLQLIQNRSSWFDKETFVSVFPLVQRGEPHQSIGKGSCLSNLSFTS